MHRASQPPTPPAGFLYAAALRGSNWRSTADVNAGAAILLSRVTRLVPASPPTSTSLVLSSYEGWGVVATELTIRPSGLFNPTSLAPGLLPLPPPASLPQEPPNTTAPPPPPPVNETPVGGTPRDSGSSGDSKSSNSGLVAAVAALAGVLGVLLVLLVIAAIVFLRRWGWLMAQPVCARLSKGCCGWGEGALASNLTSALCCVEPSWLVLPSPLTQSFP